jgi:hypothetical protein
MMKKTLQSGNGQVGNLQSNQFEFLLREECGISYKRVWQAKILEKIKIFMWLVEQKTILTIDVMLKRNWQGDPGCYFCGLLESCDHLLFSCLVAKVIWDVIAVCFQQSTRPSTYEQFWVWIRGALLGGEKVYMLGLAAVCWAIWRARNDVCYEKKVIKNPIVILYSGCTFMSYWSGLYPEEKQKLIKDGVDLMMKTTVKLLGRKKDGNSTMALMDKAADAPPDTDEA